MKRVFFFMMAFLCCFFSAMPMHISSLWKKCLGKESCRQVGHGHFSRCGHRAVQCKIKLKNHPIFFMDNGSDFKIYGAALPKYRVRPEAHQAGRKGTFPMLGANLLCEIFKIICRNFYQNVEQMNALYRSPKRTFVSMENRFNLPK